MPALDRITRISLQYEAVAIAISAALTAPEPDRTVWLQAALDTADATRAEHEALMLNADEQERPRLYLIQGGLAGVVAAAAEAAEAVKQSARAHPVTAAATAGAVAAAATAGVAFYLSSAGGGTGDNGTSPVPTQSRRPPRRPQQVATPTPTARPRPYVGTIPSSPAPRVPGQRVTAPSATPLSGPGRRGTPRAASRPPQRPKTLTPSRVASAPSALILPPVSPSPADQHPTCLRLRVQAHLPEHLELCLVGP